MHELSILNDLVREAEKRGNVKAVTVEVGDLAAIEAEELKELLSTKGWNVNIDRKKAQVRCACGFAGEPEISARAHEIVFFNCPECGKIPQVTGGNRVILKEVFV